MKIRITIILLLTLSVLVLNWGAQTFWKKPDLNISAQQAMINLDSNILEFFSFGNKKAIGSLLWLGTLLDADLEKYKNQDLNSWMFLRLKTIIELNPDFLAPYRFGAQYLSVIKDDKYGAKYIIDKGLERFTHHHKFMAIALFHYFHELKDRKKAVEIAKLCIKNCQSSSLKLFYRFERILNQNLDELMEKLEVLFLQYNPNEDSKVQKRIRKDLYSLKAEIDLKCLNSFNPNSNCSKLDFDGRPYMKDKNGGYIAPKQWELIPK